MLDRPSKGWTPSRVKTLTTLWADGYSASMCAQHLGITRNAVVGKVTRLKLPKRVTVGPAVRHTERKAQVARPAPLKAEKGFHRTARAPFEADGDGMKLLKADVWKPLPNTTPVPFHIALDRPGCRWIYGAGTDGATCNEPVHKASFCRAHYGVAYTAIPRRKRA